VDAVGDGGMIEEEEDVDRMGVRIDENGFAVGLEGVRARPGPGSERCRG